MGRTILILNYPRLGTWALFTLIKDILLFRPQMLCQSLLEKPADTNIPNSPCGSILPRITVLHRIYFLPRNPFNLWSHDFRHFSAGDFLAQVPNRSQIWGSNLPQPTKKTGKRYSLSEIQQLRCSQLCRVLTTLSAFTHDADQPCASSGCQRDATYLPIYRETSASH